MKNQESKKFQEMRSDSKVAVSLEVSKFIVSVVQMYYGLPDGYDTNRSRKRENVMGRQMAMYLLRKHTSFSLNHVGDMFKRDHSTALHAVKKINDYLFWNKETTARVRAFDTI